jgi:AraC-like DNA-binding protein
MKTELLREIIPLTPNDCFTVFNRIKSMFDFPLHYHEEIELNFIHRAEGAQRIIGDHIEEIPEYELVLIGPNLQHGWFSHKCRSTDIKEITIQFHRDLLPEKFLQRNQMSFIHTMFERSLRGILFSQKTVKAIMPRLEQLSQMQGFKSVLELMSILDDLSTSNDIRILSGMSFRAKEPFSYNSRRIGCIMKHLNANYDKEITLAELAKLVSMTEASLSRFFKARTGTTIIETLHEIRLGNATRMLIETAHSVNEVAYKCGFNNLANFYRIFKKKKSCTPSEFRESYNSSGIRTFI